jgi:hypothetical protein
MIKIAQQNASYSTTKNLNQIRINKYKGVVNGNILPETPIPPVVTPFDYSLDFSEENNSLYLPVI